MAAVATQDGTDAATQLKQKLYQQAQAGQADPPLLGDQGPTTLPVDNGFTQMPAGSPAQFTQPTPAAPTASTEPVARTTQTGTAQTPYRQVATAPDSVPVYQNGGNYYTQNADQSYTQQFQGGLPDWLSAAVGGQAGSAGSSVTPAPGTDVNQALTQFYQSQGVQPTGPGTGPTDAAYFAQKIAQTGGMTPQNIAYWFGPTGRIAQELKGQVPPETASGTPASAGQPAAPPADTAFTDYLKQLTDQNTKNQAQRDQVRSILMQHLQQAGQPVNESDSNIAAPLSAARDEAQRAQDAERTALAERMYAQGGGSLQSGALGQAIQQSAERNAGGLSSLRAGLVSQAYTQKAQQLQSDLQLALANGDTQSAQLLQAQIAGLSAAVQREGIGTSLAEFLASLNQNTALAAG